MNNTEARLREYADFSTVVIDRVSEIADIQNSFNDYSDYFDYLGITEPIHFDGNTILDIKPAVDYDDKKAMVYHLPMGNSLDPNMIYQAATLFAARPNVRLVAMGNPSGVNYPGNLLKFKDGLKVARGDLRPVVHPLLDYLSQENITTTEHVGYSYGSSKVSAAAKCSEKYDQEVLQAVQIEPADVKPRSFHELGFSFASSAKELEKYVASSGIKTFEKARANSIQEFDYNLGLMRLSNLAIAVYLKRGQFEQDTRESLIAQPNMIDHIIWGSESELAIDGLVAHSVQDLRRKFGHERVKSLRVVHAKHAFPNDIHLQAALALQSLGQAA